MRALTVFAIAACVALFSAGAYAQTAGKGKIKGKGDGNIRVNDADKGATDLGVIDIEGRIYKPSVFYVLARSDLSYQGLEFRQNFTDRIVKGALKRPF